MTTSPSEAVTPSEPVVPVTPAAQPVKVLPAPVPTPEPEAPRILRRSSDQLATSTALLWRVGVMLGFAWLMAIATFYLGMQARRTSAPPVVTLPEIKIPPAQVTTAAPAIYLVLPKGEKTPPSVVQLPANQAVVFPDHVKVRVTNFKDFPKATTVAVPRKSVKPLAVPPLAPVVSPKKAKETTTAKPAIDPNIFKDPLPPPKNTAAHKEWLEKHGKEK